MTQLPTILNHSDIDSNFPYPEYTSEDQEEIDKRIELRNRGKQVRVIGKYSQVEVSQRPSPSPYPPVYKGHVAIILADRAEVFLHPAWHPNAIRPAEEIARYNHKKVVVVGKMVPEAPESPEGAASLIAPCMLTIDSIDSGGDKRPRTFTGKAFCTIGPPQKFRLSDKIISRVKSAGVVIKKKGLTNTTRPQSIISCPHSITQFSKNI